MARFAPLAFALLAACALLVRGDDEGPWLELLSGAKDGNMKLATQAIEQGADIDRHAALGDEARRFMHTAAARLGWSARSTHRALKVARTIADLAGAPVIETAHVAEAVQYRRALQKGL